MEETSEISVILLSGGEWSTFMWMNWSVFPCNTLCLKDHSVNSDVVGSSFSGHICTRYKMVARETKTNKVNYRKHI